MTLPNGLLDWSAECSCVIVDHTHLLYKRLPDIGINPSLPNIQTV